MNNTRPFSMAAILVFAVICSASRVPAGAPVPPEVEKKVEAVLAQMTLEEKVDQLNIRPAQGDETPGLGRRSQVMNERLGIPPVLATNGPRGPRPSGDRPKNRRIIGSPENAPCPPVALMLASSWNTALQFEAGQQWGRLAKEFGLNAIWAPGLNIIKDNRAGRNSEYIGEDPYLTGAAGVALTRGMQSVGVAANAKHFVANNWETGRQVHNVTVPERPLQELYFPAFRMCVEEGDVASIMTCYNQVNGEWGSSSKRLLTDIVRHEWGFRGFFVSDWAARFGSVAQFIRSGQNIELPGRLQLSFENVKQALDDGDITMEELDACVAQTIKAKLKYLSYNGDETPSGFNSDDYKSMMLRTGIEGAVLLKNENQTLPLKRSDKIALIGPFADSKPGTVGNQGSSTIPETYVVTLKEALEKQGVAVEYAEGCGFVHYDGAEYKTSFPCRVDYFNGVDLVGPPIHSAELKALNVASMNRKDDPRSMNTDGVEGRALSASGSRSIKLTDLPEGGSWTLAAWIRLKDQFPDPDSVIFHVQGPGNAAIEVRGGALMAQTGQNRRSMERDVKPVSWDDMNNKWLSVVLVADGNDVRLYREGEMIAAAKQSSPLPKGALRFASRADNTGGIEMDIDDLRVWDRSLPAAVVEKIAQRQFDGLEAPFHKENFGNPSKYTQKGGIPGLQDHLNMSARFTGKQHVARPGKYEYFIQTRGGIRVIINGELLYELWDEQRGEGVTQRFWVEYQEAGEHDLVIEFTNKNNRREGSIKMEYIEPPEEDLFAEARRAAKEADVAVVCVGVMPGNDRQQGLQGENRDRTTYAMPGWQDELISEVVKANPNTVVLLYTAGGVDISKWEAKVPAIMEVFHQGSEGGNIVAPLLFGDENPSGKLTISWPFKQADLPYAGPDGNYRDTVNEFGYRYFDKQNIKVRYPFGHGLSYTTFSYDTLAIGKSDDERYPLIASVKLTNTGQVAGQEVVQVYVTDLESLVEQPLKELGGFAKVALEPGESKVVHIPLHWTAFQYFDTVSNAWKLEPGTFVIRAGGSSYDLALEERVDL